jgi:outer membrane protein OmpA-like peptidoglycan-associated protein
MLKTVQPGSRQSAQTADASRTTLLRSSHPPVHSESRLVRVQSTYGNQGMQRLLSRGMLQRKLTANQPGDVYEQEADRVADSVMRMPDPAATPERLTQVGSATGVQRACSCGSSSGTSGQCEECKAKATGLQRSSAGPSRSDSATPIVHDVLRSSGQPLDTATRSFMEPRFGADFSGVRVHTDAEAAESARSVEALAYTVGADVVFGTGQYAPSSAAGRRLLAHELAHTVQQGSAPPQHHTSGHETDADSPESMIARVARVAGPPSLQRRCETFTYPGRTPGVTRAPGKPCVDDQGIRGVTGVPVLEHFGESSDSLSAAHASQITTLQSTLGPTDIVEVHGYASCDGGPEFNLGLSCDRAEAVKRALTTTGSVPFTGTVTTFAHGETDEFGTGPDENRRVIMKVTHVSPPPPPPPPPPSPRPPCPAVPTTTPATCADRHAGYCAAQACFPANPWLACACRVSDQICGAIDAFELRTGTVKGGELAECLLFFDMFTPRRPIVAKGLWFETVNRCIWGHWRAALDALNDPSIPVPTGLTPEWATAVTVCRSTGVGSPDCCQAHVRAEQAAIDICLPYPTATFGRLPTDVPGSRNCSRLSAKFAPGPSFSGDFGNLSDRITFGIGLCCP